MKSKLKQIRDDANLTLTTLSSMCGVSISHLSFLEKEDGKAPTLLLAYGIANVLGKTVYEIWPDTTEIIEETITIRRIKLNPSEGKIKNNKD